MELEWVLKKLFQQFPIIYMCSMMGTFVYCLIFSPDATFEISYFVLILLFSLLGTLPFFVFYSSCELTEFQMKVRYVIHFILLEIVLLIAAYTLDMYQTFMQGIAFAFIILGVYLIVRFSVFCSDQKMAESLNEKIRERKKKND